MSPQASESVRRFEIHFRRFDYLDYTGDKGLIGRLLAPHSKDIGCRDALEAVKAYRDALQQVNILLLDVWLNKIKAVVGKGGVDLLILNMRDAYGPDRRPLTGISAGYPQHFPPLRAMGPELPKKVEVIAPTAELAEAIYHALLSS